MNRLKRLRRYIRPTYGAFAVGLVISLFVLLVLQGLPFFTKSELAAYDFELQQRGNLPTPKNLLIVGMDQTSIDFLNNGGYPLPRHYMADVVNVLCRSGAKAIALDYVFQAPAPNPADDRALARALKGCHNTVVADALTTPDANNNLAAYTHLEAPIPIIANAATRVGLANVPSDLDSAIRAIDFEQVGPGGKKGIGSTLFDAFAVEAASIALHKSVADVIRGLPQHMLINYLGSQNAGDAGQQILPTHQFVSLALDEEPHRLFKDKIVIVGCYAIVCGDIKSSPYGSMYGAVLEANAINTILNRNPLLPAGDAANDAILLALALVTTLAASRFGIWRSTAATLLVSVGYVALAFVLFDQYRIWINLITPEVALVLVFAAIMALRFATEERQKRRTVRSFGQYVKPEIVDILINTSEEEKALAGARRPISVLFVDVRGFTAMSELMEPEDVVRALDIYLEELTASVQLYDGTVDKYVGDELMAIWNAPRYQEDHPLLAVRAALDMVERMDKINQQLNAMHLPSIRYGIGVNSGDAVVGEMGSSFRKQYDVIGDTVNTGARLCSAAGGGEVIIGEPTWALIGNRLELEETEPLRLKGKRQPFRAFKVLGVKAEGQDVHVPIPSGAGVAP